eukprot:236388_1
MADTPTVVFAIMTVSSIFIIGISCVIYKCRADQKPSMPEPYRDDSRTDSNYGVDTVSEEDALMIPLDREDTIDSLRQQVVQGYCVNVANVRYIQVATADKAFKIKSGMEPREYFEGDIITFRDIAIGFVEKIPDTKVDDKPLTKRESVIHTYCVKQLKCETITELSQIRALIIFLCKIVIRAKYNKKHQHVTMRDETSDEFKSDLLPIVQWIWYEKMNQKEMDILAFAQNMSAWIQETESPHKHIHEL